MNEEYLEDPVYEEENEFINDSENNYKDYEEDELINEFEEDEDRPVRKSRKKRKEEDISLDIEKEIKETPVSGEHKNPDYGKSFEQLILENEKFAYSVVNKEFSKYSWDVKEDLFSAAKCGLVYAATKYDSKQEEAKFISYAVNWIRYYVHEEVRKLNPIKLNQNFVCKRNKLKRAIAKFKEENNQEPTSEELSAIVGMSEKVIGNVYGVNGGENFNFVSFQSLMNSGSSKNEDDGSMMENKLTNEYLENSLDSSGMDSYELKDLLEAMQKSVSKEDYDIFYDKYINGMSYSDIAKKYKLNFASSASYRLKCIEKVCKKLLDE